MTRKYLISGDQKQPLDAHESKALHACVRWSGLVLPKNALRHSFVTYLCAWKQVADLGGTCVNTDVMGDYLKEVQWIRCFIKVYPLGSFFIFTGTFFFMSWLQRRNVFRLHDEIIGQLGGDSRGEFGSALFGLIETMNDYSMGTLLMVNLVWFVFFGILAYRVERFLQTVEREKGDRQDATPQTK